MTIKQKKKLIEEYLSKCPFIEFHQLQKINDETATIDIAFDIDYFDDINSQVVCIGCGSPDIKFTEDFSPTAYCFSCKSECDVTVGAI